LCSVLPPREQGYDAEEVAAAIEGVYVVIELVGRFEGLGEARVSI
jgi:hypothetical protein